MNKEEKNIAIGSKALSNLIAGNNNVCIGTNAGAEIIEASNQVRIME